MLNSPKTHETKMIALYVRTSVITSKTDRQELAMVEGVEGKDFRFYTDTGASGAVALRDRPAGRRLWEDVENGEISEIRFHEISRAGRNLVDVIATLHQFAEMGVQVVVEKEGIRLLQESADGERKINPVASMILSVLASIANIERTTLLERQAEGIAVAKAKGKYLGRRSGSYENDATFLAKPKSKKITKLLGDNLSVTKIALIVGCSHNLVRKVRDKRAA